MLSPARVAGPAQGLVAAAPGGLSPSLQAPELPFGRDELVRLDRISLWFAALPSGVVCRAGSAPGFRPGGRVTFFWAQKKVTKEEGLNAQL